METLNCMKCKYRHEDNGNCTAVGGFCTAVTAAHCPLLREYLDTGLTPDQVVNAKNIIDLAFADDTSKAERIRKLVAADDEGRVVVLPCKVGDTIYFARANPILQYKVTGYEMGEASISQVCSKHVDKETGLTFNFTFRPSSIGKTVFLTREEAEKALQEIQGKEDADGATDKPE